ncbi:MAG: hypothetical protein WD184_05885 [Acidimicrobiia bacterium]
MGFFKEIKEVKETIAGVPEMIEQAQQLSAQAQEMQVAQAAMAQAAVAQAATAGSAGSIDPAMLEPIGGISMERYAQIAKTVGEKTLDQAGTEALVRKHGHTPEDWQAAYDGWNSRFQGNMALAVQFGTLFQQTSAL